MDDMIEYILNTDTQKIAIENILNDDEIKTNSLTYLMAVTFNADFAYDEEKVDVAGILHKHIFEPVNFSIIPIKSFSFTGVLFPKLKI